MKPTSFLAHVHTMVDNRETRHGRAFEYVMFGMITVSVVTFSLETIPGLSKQARSALYVVEAVTVGFFTVEYGLRLYVARKRLTYVFGFYGIIDMLAVLPFYLAVLGVGHIDARVLRMVRFMRVFRVLKFLRYNQAADRLHRAILISKEEIVLFVILSMILLYVSASGIWYFEREIQPEKFGSVFDGLWWAVATLTTVGYGDVYPVTPGGRFFTFLLLMIGLGIIAIPSGIIASALSKARLEQDESGG